MNKEKQRIAIAEACGWALKTDNPKYDWYAVNPSGFEVAWAGALKPRWPEDVLPDYLSDLNAMAQAEKTLAPRKLEEYADLLYRKCNAGISPEEAETHDFLVSVVCATAAQRAEAFLKTIRKWEES